MNKLIAEKFKAVLFAAAVILLMTSVCTYAAAATIILDDLKESYDISNALDVHIDYQGNLSLNELQKKSFPEPPGFWISGKNTFGFTRAAVWARFSVINKRSSSEELYLILDLPLCDSIEFYKQETGGSYSMIETGDLKPFSQREITRHNFIFHINPANNTVQTYYIRLKSQDSMMLPLSIVTRKGFQTYEWQSSFLFGIYYGILLIMILYNLFIFFSTRDITYFYYILYALAYFFFQMNYNGLSYRYLWPENPWWNSHSISFFTGIGLLFGLMFARTFMNFKKVVPQLDRLMLLLISANVTSCFISLFLQPGYGLVVMNGLAALSSLILLAGAFISLKKGYTPSRFFLTAWMFFLAGVIGVALLNLGFIPYNVIVNYSSQIGSAAEITLLSIALADRINVIKREHFYAQEKIISMQNQTRETLEKLVSERTYELEIEKNKLHDHNEVMIKDLKMAKRIQQKFIPSRSPVDFIASFYKPMELVGGDFYDFVRFRDQNIVGIFLSDVSGHGVPAAFITSMIKSVILEGSSRREDPAGLLNFINEILYGQTADNFVTAFYCVYNSSTRELLYANAGHPFPYIIQESGITTLGGRRHPPLAAFSRERLAMKGKILENTRVTLAPGSRLLLYTDGITEAQNEQNPSEFYETGGLEHALMKYRSLPCSNFLQSVYESLIEYRGSDNFDDDVCLICIEIPEMAEE